MKTILAKATALAAASVLVFSLAACSGEENPEPAPSNTENSSITETSDETQTAPFSESEELAEPSE